MPQRPKRPMFPHSHVLAAICNGAAGVGVASRVIHVGSKWAHDEQDIVYCLQEGLADAVDELAGTRNKLRPHERSVPRVTGVAVTASCTTQPPSPMSKSLSAPFRAINPGTLRLSSVRRLWGSENPLRCARLRPPCAELGHGTPLPPRDNPSLSPCPILANRVLGLNNIY